MMIFSPDRIWLISWLLAVIVLMMPPPASGEPFEVRALVMPEQEAVLSSRIKGRIEKLHVREGQKFQKGQPLVELDCDLLEAELLKARTDLTAASDTHEANLRLQEFGSVSELDMALSSAKQNGARAEVQLNETRVAMCIIEAPFTGKVVKRRAQPFENVGPDDPLLEVLDDSRLKLHLLVPSHWLQWLKEGQFFAVRIDETGKEYQARVTTIGVRVNPVNQTLELEAIIDGKHSDLLAGMSGMAAFPSPTLRK